MKKIRMIPIILIICTVFSLISAAAAAEPASELPALSAKAAFVGDLGTGKSVFSLNAEDRRAPASLTKIMTALLAVEAVESGKAALDEMITVQTEAFYDLADDGSSAKLVPGEIMSLKDLLYCALLGSANDACNVIGIHIGGSLDNFIAMMNERAADLGCENTHFVNTHGLPDEEHYSSAEDLFTIFSEDMEHELFVNFASTKKYKTAATNVSAERELINTNALINEEAIYGKIYGYAPAICGKTGHTEAAGYCLISAAEKDGMRLCTVVLGCDKEPTYDSEIFHNFTESEELYKWAFGNFGYKTLLTANEPLGEIGVTMGEAESVALYAGSDVIALLPNDSDPASFETRLEISEDPVAAPVLPGQILGKVSIVSGDGAVIGSAKLLAANAVALDGGDLVLNKLGEFLGHTWLLLLVVVIVIIVVVYVVLAVRYRAKRKAQLRQKKP